MYGYWCCMDGLYGLYVIGVRELAVWWLCGCVVEKGVLGVLWLEMWVVRLVEVQGIKKVHWIWWCGVL